MGLNNWFVGSRRSYCQNYIRIVTAYNNKLCHLPYTLVDKRCSLLSASFLLSTFFVRLFYSSMLSACVMMHTHTYMHYLIIERTLAVKGIEL